MRFTCQPACSYKHEEPVIREKSDAAGAEAIRSARKWTGTLDPGADSAARVGALATSGTVQEIPDLAIRLTAVNRHLDDVHQGEHQGPPTLKRSCAGGHAPRDTKDSRRSPNVREPFAGGWSAKRHPPLDYPRARGRRRQPVHDTPLESAVRRSRKAQHRPTRRPGARAP